MSQILVAIFAVGALFAVAPASVSADQGRYLYIQTNNILEDQNAVIGYERMEDGKLKMLPGSPFPTHGTGMNNNTFGKVGPNDNDSPLIISPDGKRLFTVNAHSNTIAVFDIAHDGSLRHVNGSPFPSKGRMPNSLSISGDTLVVSNRNGDYHQLAALRGKAKANYVSFRIDRNGRLRFLSKVNVTNGHKPTQVHVAQTNNRIVFGNDFQVDADFDRSSRSSTTTRCIWVEGMSVRNEDG